MAAANLLPAPPPVRQASSVTQGMATATPLELTRGQVY